MLVKEGKMVTSAQSRLKTTNKDVQLALIGSAKDMTGDERRKIEKVKILTST